MSKSLPSKPAPVEVSATIQAFANRFTDLMAVRDSSDSLLNDALVYCQTLERALIEETVRLNGLLRDRQNDLDKANAFHRDLEQKLLHKESKINSLYKENDTHKAQTRNPYIAVLIDGDGLLFQDAWIRQGVEGGKKAAETLRGAVGRQWTGKCPNTQIIAKVVANCAGLARALNIQDFRDFVAGFNQSNAAFDFVDIGSGKERRADAKIRDNIRWHLQNHNCQQILLGVSHDASYTVFIEDLFRTDPTARDRISIIEGGAPLAADLKATGANTTRLEKDLFRADRLVERTSAYAAAAVTRTASPAGSVASSGGGGSGGANSSTVSYANAITNGTPPPTMSIPLAPNKPSPRAKAHTAANGGSSSSSPSPSPSGHGGAQYQKIPPQQPNWNPGARGLDEPIIVNVAVMDAVKKRKDTDKLCNNHFLRGPCAKGDGCNFVHDYKPNSEEINAIAVLARQNPCTHGQDCENWECIYGHHCPSIRDGVCTHPYCKFDEDQHPPGTKFTSSKASNR